MKLIVIIMLGCSTRHLMTKLNINHSYSEMLYECGDFHAEISVKGSA